MSDITATILQPTYDVTVTQPVIEVTLNGYTVINQGLVNGFTAENTSGATIVQGRAVTIKNDGGIEYADNEGGRDCNGFAIEEIAEKFSGFVYANGEILELADWNLITASGFLTPKQLYYLSDSPGRIQPFPPSVGYSQLVGEALTITRLQINIQQSIKL